jgi:ribosome-associated protein
MEYKSKTQKKKEAESLQKLGEQLVDLSAEQLKDIDLPADIRDAVIFAKTIKSRRALHRQMQYIGMLMRNIDPAPVREALYHLEQGLSQYTTAFKETETWRDELIAGNTVIIDEILKQCPDADRRQIVQLVKNAIKEKEENRPPQSSRALFRYLKKIRPTDF